MRIGIIGRTRWLFDSAKALLEAGHEIAFVITSKAAPDYDVKESDFQALAESLGVPYRQRAQINREETLEWIRSQGALDIGVSINYSGIIGSAAIGSFKHGILNAHGGDLPRYRGNACQAWALINGESRIGLCVHRMVPDELDSGVILARDYLEVDCDTRIGQVYAWMVAVIPQLMVGSVSKLASDPSWVLEVQDPDPAKALRCYPRIPEDGKLDWSNSREDALRLINASSEPYDGAFSFLGEEKVRIWRAALAPEEKGQWLGIPGQVTEINREAGWVDVLCEDGKLRILEIEMKGGERQAPAEVIRSIRTRFSIERACAL